MPRSAPSAGKPASRLTRRWIKNASDERAVANGCRFDERRAMHAVEWVQGYCHLYEGDQAGELIELRDWALDFYMRLFGWVVYSEDWGREVRRFRQACAWVPKKCKKSPSLASIGLYTCIGDGEQGQKVYSVAKDGKQAMTSHRHAMEMVKRSPALMSECKINQGTGQITHLPTSSIYTILAGDNLLSQEGINGSLMVDETHVVGRELMSIISRAGISRAEPLHVEVSTAGNNPDGYGKERWDYGRKVEAAESGYENDHLLFVHYGAPQDLSDADLAADPERYGKMANPAWGHTVKRSEYLADYEQSKRSLSALADFKMYRLNVWQSSSSPWLRESDWALCRDTFTPDDLAGQECWAGLDLSKTQDMTALVLCFRGDAEGEYRILPYFWLPEEAARDKAHLAPFLSWAASGHLTLTPGSVLDYGFVRSKFRELASRYSIQILAYDPTYAEETTQALEQGVTDHLGNLLEEGTGVVREVFAQSWSNFAGATAEYERHVIAHTLRHNGHPIMNWQVGHVRVRSDANNNKRPVKPKPDDYRKIDGVVAGIMALAKASLAPPDQTPGVYTLP